MSFNLPALPYSFDALEPYIDARTVEIHYTKHHTAYLNNLNGALEKYPELFEKDIETLLSHLNDVPEDIRAAVRNNGGGFYNHNLYWRVMSGYKGGEPTGKLADAIRMNFGSIATFKQEFEKAGMSRFGSGWAWLSLRNDGGLAITSTPNQDTPLADNLYPLIGVDVWEHAYYLKYQNRRAEYLSNWWNVVNWEEVANRFAERIV